MAPSTARGSVILAGLCIALVMDGVHLSLCLKIRRMRSFNRSSDHCINTLLIGGMTVLEILCIVVCSTVADGYGYLGFHVFYQNAYGATWIYSILQTIAVVKWVIGANLISETYPYSLSGASLESEQPNWWYGSCGLYISASGILLNAILVGVRAQWQFK